MESFTFINTKSSIIGASCAILAAAARWKRRKKGPSDHELPKEVDDSRGENAPPDPALKPLFKGLFDAFCHLARNPLALPDHHPRKIGGPWLCLDCKAAIGHDLTRLSTLGYRIYENFPARRSTIDHIVVGPNGVFAIETKGRKAPEGKKAAPGTLMIYDGRILASPIWVDAKSVDQAQRHARWLSAWLSNGIRQNVDVYPLLTVPGWLTNRNDWGDVLLVKKQDYELLTARRGVQLSDELIERIARQIEQRFLEIPSTGR